MHNRDIQVPRPAPARAARPLRRTGAVTRRDFLRWNLSCATLFSAAPHVLVWAQTPDGAQLVRLPKIALVIGNAKYRTAPLKNPVNDARAIGQTLKDLGFEVSQHLDATKAELDAALTAHVAQLAKRKCVGLVYYAGHGIQAAWKNYLLAVDVGLDSLADVIKGSVDLNALMAGLNRAANPMNVIVLDACRDNPFGESAGREQKGLSQMDAPPGTLLAYATAPGNTASDGEGVNGLYTESLLREIRVNEAKIEDVFKRVRLTVRRRSQGAQIPWESTSLEDDFYFLPPADLVAQAIKEEARAREEAKARDEARAREEAKAREEARVREETKAREDAKAREAAKAREEARARDEAKARADAKAGEEARARDEAKAAGDEARAREDARAREEAKVRDEAKAREDAKARDEAKAREEAKTIEEAKARDESKAREATTARDDAKAREEARGRDANRAQDEARARAFAEELRLWESIQASTSPEPLEAYLRRHPSGQFSELAQLQLDRVLARLGEKPVQIAPSLGNPYTKGTARSDTAYRVGDAYSYRMLEKDSGREVSRYSNLVTTITGDEVLFDDGRLITDLLGNVRRFPDGRRPTGSQVLPLMFEVGRRWTTRFLLTTPDGRAFDNEFKFHVSARESITVPAGTFDCYRYEGVGTGRGPGMAPGVHVQTEFRSRTWMAPGLCRRPIVIETYRAGWVRGNLQVAENSRRELVAFKQT